IVAVLILAPGSGIQGRRTALDFGQLPRTSSNRATGRETSAPAASRPELCTRRHANAASSPTSEKRLASKISFSGLLLD
ncbi:hypothetical protein HPB47_015167, partial [Ixodes persulcatus]